MAFKKPLPGQDLDDFLDKLDRPSFLKFPFLSLRAGGGGNKLHWYDSKHAVNYLFSFENAEANWEMAVLSIYEEFRKGPVHISTKAEGLTKKKRALFPKSALKRLWRAGLYEWAMSPDRAWNRLPSGVDMNVVLRSIQISSETRRNVVRYLSAIAEVACLSLRHFVE